MKKLILSVTAFVPLGLSAIAQSNVGIGTSTPAAKLDISSNNSGVLIPRIALTTGANSADPLVSPAQSTLIYNTATVGTGVNAVIPGFYYWNGSQWVMLLDGATVGVATSVSNTVNGNTISTTVDGATGTAVTVPNIYTADGALTGNRTITQGANNLTINSSTGNLIFNPSSTGAVAIGNTNPNAIAVLDLSNSTNRGLMLPRMTTTQRNALTASLSITAMGQIQGLTIYNTSTLCMESFIGTGPANSNANNWQPIGCGCNSAPAQPGAITYTPNAATICQGYGNFVFSIAPVAGASSYNWTLPLNANITNGAGTSSITVSFANNAASGAQTVSVTAQNSCGISAAATLPITVNAIPVITSQPANATICAQGGTGNTGNTSFNVQATGTALFYQWQVNTGIGGWNNVSGGIYSGATASNVTTSTLVLTAATAAYSGYQYQCVISGTCSPTVTTTPVTLTVNALPVVSNQTVTTCSGSSGSGFSITPSSSLTSTTYTWTAPTVGGGISGGAAQVTAVSSISGLLSNSSAISTGIATYTVTPFSTAGCAGSTFTVTVTVNPTPQVNTPTLASTTSCNVAGGGAAQAALFLTTTNNVSGGAFTFNWLTTTANGTGVGTGGGSATSVPGFNGINGTNTWTSDAITVTPVYTAGGQTCTGTPLTNLFSFYIAPTAALTNSNTSLNPAVCSGVALSPSINLATLATGSGGVVTYPWGVAYGSGISCTANCGSSGTNPISPTLKNTSTTATGTATYSITPTYTLNTIGCPGTPASAVITVSPIPAVGNITLTTCSASAWSTTPTSSLPNTVYTWGTPAQAGTVSGGLAASNQTNVSGTLANSSTTTTATATYTVTPQTTGCPGSPGATFTVTVTVNPTLQVNTPSLASTTSCNVTGGGAAQAALALTTTNNVSGGSFTFNWIRTTTNNTGVISGATNATSIPAFNGINGTNTWTSDAISVTPVYASGGQTCTGSATALFSYYVSPTAALSNSTPSLNPTVCSGVAASITLATLATGTGSVVTFPWGVAYGSGISCAANCGSSGTNPIAPTLNNPSATTTATYSITPTYTLNTMGCPGTAATATITVEPIPALSLAASPTALCLGNTITLTASPSGGTLPYGTYTWSSTTTNNGLAASTTATNTATPTSAITQTYKVNLSDANNCGVSALASVNVPVTPVVNPSISGGASPICNNTAPGTITASATGGTGTYSYLWYLNGTSTGLTTTTYNPTLSSGANAIYCAISSGACATANTSTTTIATGPCYSTTACGSNWGNIGNQQMAANSVTCSPQTTTPTFTTGGSYFQWDGIAAQTYQLTINPGVGWTTPAWQFWQYNGSAWTYVSQGNTAVATVSPTITSSYGAGWNLIVIFNGTSCPPAAAAGLASVTYQRISAPIPSAATVSSPAWLTYGCNNYTVSASAINSCNTDYGTPANGYGIMALINYQGTNSANNAGYFDWAPTQAQLNLTGYTANQHACSPGTGWVGETPSNYGSTACTLVSGSQSVSGYTTTVNFVVQPNSTFPKAGAINAVSVYAGDACGNVSGWTNYQLNFSSSGGSSSFAANGTIQSFTVPCGVTSITVSANGAQGGPGQSVAGGLGAKIVGTFTVAANNTIKVLAGSQGGTGVGSGYGGGGGGGASYVYNQTTGTLLMIAGGGGGGGNSTIGINASVSANGVAGSGTGFGAGGTAPAGGNLGTYAGGGGGYTGNGTFPIYCGGGLSYTNGGTGGTPYTTGYAAGGFGGGGGTYAGGGGGGGYGGGGGGGWSSTPNAGPGGGGGSYNAGTSPSNTVGDTGPGSVTITY